jgi:hypothetical protein
MSEPKKIYYKGEFVGTELRADDPEWNDLSRHLYDLINDCRDEDDAVGLFRDEDGDICSFDTLNECYTYLDENGKRKTFDPNERR